MALMAFLKGHCQGADKGKAIVFCQSRNEVSFYQALIAAAEKETEKTKEQEEREKSLAEQLGPLSVYFLHGGMEQRDRTASFKGFCGATSGALVCTDVAARGLDLPAVSWILQMSAPPRYAIYGYSSSPLLCSRLVSKLAKTPTLQLQCRRVCAQSGTDSPSGGQRQGIAAPVAQGRGIY
jgi:hypothetical protein